MTMLEMSDEPTDNMERTNGTGDVECTSKQVKLSMEGKSVVENEEYVVTSSESSAQNKA